MRRILPILWLIFSGLSYHTEVNLYGEGQVSFQRLNVREYDLVPSSRPIVLEFPNNSLTASGSTVTVSFAGSALGSGSTNYIQNINTLQSGSTFYVSSGTAVYFNSVYSSFTTINSGNINSTGRVAIGANSATSLLDIVNGSVTIRGQGAGLSISTTIIFGVDASSIANFVTMSSAAIYNSRGNLALDLTGGGYIRWDGGTGAPASNSWVGTKLVMFPLASNTSYAQGVEASFMWFNTGAGYKWYRSGTAKHVISASDNFCVNCTAPTRRLEVNGNSLFKGSMTITAVNATAVSNSVFNINTDSFTVTGEGKAGIGVSTPTSLIDVVGGSVTIRSGNTGNGTDGGISVSSMTFKGIPIIASTWTTRGYEGYVLMVTSGAIAANTSITISASGMGVTNLGVPVCGEFENVNTAAISVRVKSLSGLPTSFTVFNADIVNNKNFTCMFPAQP